MASYLPQPGTTGSLTINNLTLCADSWEWDGAINLIKAPSFCGGGYMEFAVGKATNTMVVTGTWDGGFNPFSAGLKVGTQGNIVILKINALVFARSTNVIIVDWNIKDEADGVAYYTLTMSGDFIFNDFSNTPAIG